MSGAHLSEAIAKVRDLIKLKLMVADSKLYFSWTQLRKDPNLVFNVCFSLNRLRVQSESRERETFDFVLDTGEKERISKLYLGHC